MSTNAHSLTSTETAGKAHRSDELAAAALLLDRMGISSDYLIHHDRAMRRIPTFAEYVPVVAEAASAGTIRTYHPYWQRIVQRWGDRRLDEPTPSEIRKFAQWITANITVRRNSRDGRGAVELFVSALRCIYAHAVDDGIIERVNNPSLKVRKPARLPNGR